MAMSRDKCGEIPSDVWVSWGGRGTRTQPLLNPFKAKMVTQPRGVCEWYKPGDDRPFEVTRTGTPVWWDVYKKPEIMSVGERLVDTGTAFDYVFLGQEEDYLGPVSGSLPVWRYQVSLSREVDGAQRVFTTKYTASQSEHEGIQNGTVKLGFQAVATMLHMARRITEASTYSDWCSAKGLGHLTDEEKAGLRLRDQYERETLVTSNLTALLGADELNTWMYKTKEI